MNVVVISTTLDKPISIKRRNNLFTSFSKYGFPIVFNYAKPIESRADVPLASFTNILDALTTFEKMDYEYGLICEDDFEPHPDFANELRKTLDVLPDDWRCLHLCPGYLWGRFFRNKPVGTLNPEGPISDIPVHETGRVFMNCDPDVFARKLIWLGGPVAMIINKKRITEFIWEFKAMFLKHCANNDVIFTRMLKPCDFICREPLLGHENEQGGTTWE